MQGSVLKMEHILTLRGILALIFHNSLYNNWGGVSNYYFTMVLLCETRCSPFVLLNFKAYICEKIFHRPVVIFIRQMKVHL
jgi:hypothetical protein